MITFTSELTKENKTKSIESKGKILIIPANCTDKRFKPLGHGLAWIRLDEYQQEIK